MTRAAKTKFIQRTAINVKFTMNDPLNDELQMNPVNNNHDKTTKEI